MLKFLIYYWMGWEVTFGENEILFYENLSRRTWRIIPMGDPSNPFIITLIKKE